MTAHEVRRRRQQPPPPPRMVLLLVLLLLAVVVVAAAAAAAAKAAPMTAMGVTSSTATFAEAAAATGTSVGEVEALLLRDLQLNVVELLIETAVVGTVA